MAADFQGTHAGTGRSLLPPSPATSEKSRTTGEWVIAGSVAALHTPFQAKIGEECEKSPISTLEAFRSPVAVFVLGSCWISGLPVMVAL